MKHIRKIITFILLLALFIAAFLTSCNQGSQGHTEEIIPSVPPTVEHNGYTEGLKCSSCGYIIKAPEEISLLTAVLDEGAVRGRISVTLSLPTASGEYTLYLADNERCALDGYTPIGKIVGGGTSRVEELVFTDEAKYIVARGSDSYQYFVKIPEEYQLYEAEYSFGAVSDVHYNRGDYFNIALDFFDEQGVDLVGVSGDITDNSESELIEKYNSAIRDRAYRVFTTSGNHDVRAVKDGRWAKEVNTAINSDPQVICIGENGIDFAYAPSEKEDILFVFLCQTNWSYPSNPKPDVYTILEKEQLVWLRNVLKESQEKTVFLFFHTFLSAPDGSQEGAVGNLRNPGGYAYDLPFSYGSADEIEFRALMKEYKNVVYFSGHSHWMFEMERFNPNLNFSNFDGEYCYMVHSPSVSEPRWIGENDTSRTSKTGEASEGWIVQVYDEAIILIPVDFISETFYTQYMKIISTK